MSFLCNVDVSVCIVTGMPLVLVMNIFYSGSSTGVNKFPHYLVPLMMVKLILHSCYRLQTKFGAR